MVREVHWKFVDLIIVKQDTWFRLLLVFLFFLTFHKATHLIWGEVESLLLILLQSSDWVCRWKNCENRSIFSKDMDGQEYSVSFFDSRCIYYIRQTIPTTTDHWHSYCWPTWFLLRRPCQLELPATTHDWHVNVTVQFSETSVSLTLQCKL